MKEIKLNHGKTALVDDEDFERISQYHWSAQYCKGTWRATTTKHINGKPHRYKMARMVMNVTDKKVKVSAINHNALDCRKDNLRLATHAQTCYTQRKTRGSSKYKGVSYHKTREQYRAYIQYDGKMMWLGWYGTDENAAGRAYNEAAIKYHGEFAELNKIEE